MGVECSTVRKGEAKTVKLFDNFCIIGDSVRITFKSSAFRYFKFSTYQLFDIITDRKNKIPENVTVSIEEYMDKRKMNDRKRAVRQFLGDVKTLMRIGITLTNGKSIEDDDYSYMSTRIICYAEGNPNNKFDFSFGHTVLDLLNRKIKYDGTVESLF